jgi:hypothetical protein
MQYSQSMWMLLALALSQAGSQPLTPPPLVPLEPSSPSTPPTPPPVDGAAPSAAPAPATPPEVQQDVYDLRRAGIVSAATAGVVALGLTGMIVAIGACTQRDGTCQAAIGVGGVPIVYLASGLSGYFVHRALDGQGSYASSVAGASMGAGASVFAWFLIFSMAHSAIDTTGDVALTVATSVLVGAGAGLMVELSHKRTLDEQRERQISVAVLPVKGGAGLALTGTW